MGASRKARHYLRKLLSKKHKSKTLIHAARIAVSEARKAVKKLVIVSKKIVKKDIKSIKKNGKKIGLKVHIKLNCKCQPKVRSLAAHKPKKQLKTPVQKKENHEKRILAPLKKMLDLN